MRIVFAMVLLSACTIPPSASNKQEPRKVDAPPPPPVTASRSDAPALVTHSVPLSYKGGCAPAGSREGCYVLTVEPSGKANLLLHDAGVAGSLKKNGSTWIFTPDGKARPVTFTVKDQRHLDSEYGEFKLEASKAIEQAAAERMRTVAVVKGLFWLAQPTPLLPERWPDGRLSYVLYAFALEDGLADGEHELEPWGLAVLQPDGKVVTESKTVRPFAEIGIQGVQPSTYEGPWVTEVEDELTALLAAGPPPARAPGRIAQAYCAWKDGNGLIAAKLGLDGFWAWLGCP
jgi:hypothetical protein